MDDALEPQHREKASGKCCEETGGETKRERRELGVRT